MTDAVANDANKFWIDCPAVWAPFPLPPLRAPKKLMELVAAGAEEVAAMLVGPSSVRSLYGRRCCRDWASHARLTRQEQE